MQRVNKALDFGDVDDVRRLLAIPVLDGMAGSLKEVQQAWSLDDLAWAYEAHVIKGAIESSHAKMTRDQLKQGTGSGGAHG